MGIEFLKELINAISPSGNEIQVRNLIKKEIKPYVNSIKIDSFGNLICTKKGKGRHVVLAAHMDEIGLMINKVDPDGFLKVSTIGGVEPITLLGQRVRIFNRQNKEICDGVVTFEELHDDKEIPTEPLTSDDLYIDVGLTKEECREIGIDVGNYVVPHQNFSYLGSKNIITGKALDDRIGCYILIELAKKLSKVKNTGNIHYVFTVQEEIGLYGSKTSVYNLKPDWSIAVDVTSCPDGALDAYKIMGKGPLITIKDAELIANKCLNDWLINLAEKNKIPLQKEVSSFGTTDATNIMLSKGGVPSTVLGVAVRNLHSTIGIAHIEDINNAIKLLELLLKNPPKICLV